MSPLPGSELDSLDDAINTFQQVASILKGKPGNKKQLIFKSKPILNLKDDLKSLAYIIKLPPLSPPLSPPPIPPPPIPPQPANYSPSPPPPPVRAHIPLKVSPPPPPARSDQPKAAMRRIQESGSPTAQVINTASPAIGDRATPSNRCKDFKRVSCTGLAVEHLDTLLADMETFNLGSSGKKQTNIRKVKIEVEAKDELEQKLDSLTDKLVNAFDPKSEVKWKEFKEEEELGVCQECKSAIKSSAVLAGSFSYHPDCFTCAHCGDKLGSKFFCVDSSNYCEKHKEVALDRCTQCGDSIREGAVMVSGMSYHPHCFTCRECGLVIDKKFYTTEDKKFLCEHDYKQSRDKCSHCGLPILERILTAVDKKFHPVCFRCALCDAALDGVPFLLSGSSVNCQPCYTKYKAAPCARCGEGVVSTGKKKTTLITCNGLSFHQECYNCQDCGQNLCGQFVCCDKGDIVCFACDVKRRN